MPCNWVLLKKKVFYAATLISHSQSFGLKYNCECVAPMYFGSLWPNLVSKTPFTETDEAFIMCTACVNLTVQWQKALFSSA